jgi:hypothetical protein
MGSRGRPPLEEETIHVQIKLSLRPGRDDDLIAFFNSLPPRTRAAAVMAAMRSGHLEVAVDEGDFSEDDMDTSLMDSFVL